MREWLWKYGEYIMGITICGVGFGLFLWKALWSIAEVDRILWG